MKTRSKLIILKRIVSDDDVLSKEDMLSALRHDDIQVSTRTLERYIKELSTGFFIEYASEKGGYIKHSLIENDEVELFMHLLNVELMSQTVVEGLQKKLVSKNTIVLSTKNNFKGIAYVQPILEAIEKNKTLKFQYHTQFVDAKKRHVIPQFLKEYRNRWYLIGLDLNKGEAVRTFGLDRIENLALGEKLTYKRDIDNRPLFEDMLGVDTRSINGNYKTPITIKFKAFDTLPNYFKTLPFHKSQQIEEDTDGYTLFSIKLFPNYEFKQHIYLYSPNIQITEPQWLADQILNDLERTIARYK